MPSTTRLGDKCTGHGCFPSRPSNSGSGNVFINGKASVRLSDSYDPHSCKSTHDGVLSSGSGTVFVNGRAIGRVGDNVSCGSNVAEGSGNVFAGG